MSHLFFHKKDRNSKPSETLGRLERLEMEMAAMLECQELYCGTLFGWQVMWEQTDVDRYIDRELAEKPRIVWRDPILLPEDFIGKLFDRMEEREKVGQ